MTKTVLKRILILRINGKNFKDIGFEVGLDPGNIQKWCRKYNVVPYDSRTAYDILNHVDRIEKPPPKVLPKPRFFKLDPLLSEKELHPKTYQDYLRDERNRKENKKLVALFSKVL